MSCCCGGSPGRGCFQFRIDNITVSNPSCTGIDSSIDGLDLQVSEYESSEGIYLSGCTIFGRAGLAKSDIKHWSLASSGRHPLALKSHFSSASGEVCTPNFSPDGFGGCWWGNCNDNMVVFVQDQSDYIYIFIIEPNYQGHGTGGDVRYCSSAAFHVLKSSSGVSDLSDLAALNALSWTKTFYEFIDEKGDYTGWDDYFLPVMDFSSSTVTFTGCNQCTFKIPFAYTDSRDDIDEIMGKLYPKNNGTPRTAAEIQALYFGTKPSDLDLTTALIVGTMVPNGMKISHRGRWDPYEQVTEIFGSAQAGDLKVTYSGGDYTGPAPGKALNAPQTAWNEATTTGPLNGASRTLSTILADSWASEQKKEGEFPTSFYRVSSSTPEIYNKIPNQFVSNRHTPVFTYNYADSDIRIEGMQVQHPKLHLNAHNIEPEGCDYDPSSVAYGIAGYNPWEPPQTPYPDCYYTSKSYFEDGRFDTYFTSDRAPHYTFRQTGADQTLFLPEWMESAIIFAVAETSDGSNWDVYPCALVQQRISLTDHMKECYDPFGHCRASGTKLNCQDSSFGNPIYKWYDDFRGCEPEGDLLSTYSESRVTYTVARATTPVSVASDSVWNAVTKAMQGYTGSLTNWSIPLNFGLTGLREGIEDRNAFKEWTHIPPAHGNSVFNEYNSIEIEVNECEGINPCVGCKCPRLVHFQFPCLDDNVSPFNNLTNGGPCWQEIKDRFMNQRSPLVGCDPIATSCEGCDGTKTVSATVGGTANSTCLNCTAINQTYVLTTQFTGNGKLGAPTASELSTYGSVCDGYMDSFYVDFCGGSPTSYVTVQVRIHEDGLIKCAVENGTSSGLAIFSRTFSPGDYSPNCSISESWTVPDSTTGGLCNIINQSLSITVS